MRSLFLTINQTYNLLLQEESQREIHSSTHFISNYVSLNTSSFKYQKSNSFNEKFIDNERSSIQCNCCKKSWHSIDKCYKIHGFLYDFKFTKNKRFAAQVDTIATSSIPQNPSSLFGTTTSNTGDSTLVFHSTAILGGFTPEMCTQLMNFIKYAKISESNSSFVNFADNSASTDLFSTSSDIYWIIDSGATDHMCAHKSLFLSLQPLSQNLIISLPNVHIIDVFSISTVSLS